MSSDLLHLHALAWKKVQIQKLQDCTASKAFPYSYALLSSDFMATPSTELCPKGWNAYAAAYAPAVLAYAQE